jgi:putative ABC transport system permease protein
VRAIYSRSLGFGDVVVPSDASGGEHLGTTTVGEVLVQGDPRANLAGALGSLAGRYGGLQVASRTVVNAQAERDDAQNSYLNNLLLSILVLLAGVALVNTLVVSTLEQRESILLLRRVGSSARQLFTMVVLRTVTLSVVGLLLGAAAGAAAVLAVTRALTGTWHPYLTWTPTVVGTLSVLVLSVLAVLGPTAWVLRRR